jgi:hypothetical protein
MNVRENTEKKYGQFTTPYLHNSRVRGRTRSCHRGCDQGPTWILTCRICLSHQVIKWPWPALLAALPTVWRRLRGAEDLAFSARCVQRPTQREARDETITRLECELTERGRQLVCARAARRAHVTQTQTTCDRFSSVRRLRAVHTSHRHKRHVIDLAQREVCNERERRSHPPNFLS